MEQIQNMPQQVESHLEGLLSMTDNTECGTGDLKNMWMEKERLFQKQRKSLSMIELDEFTRDDSRGAILLTYSGSLISIYSVKDTMRRIEYASIKIRNDVPDIVVMEKSSLEQNISINHPASFTEGDIKKSSSVYKIISFESGTAGYDFLPVRLFIHHFQHGRRSAFNTQLHISNSSIF